MRIYRSGQATGYFFALFFLYTLASLPFAYVFSFRPRTSIIGFTNFFIVNVIANVIDAVINSFTIFTSDSSPADGPSNAYKVVTIIRWILAALLPSVNLKHALYNSQLHENRQCIAIFNAYIKTSFSLNEPWGSLNKPGIGGQILIFCLQAIFWTLVLVAIENRRRISQFWQRRRAGKDKDFLVINQSLQWNDAVRDRTGETEECDE